MPIRRSGSGGRPLPSVGVIDVRLLRTDLDGVKKNLARRGIDLGQVDEAAALDSRLRQLESERDDARRRINELSKQVGGLRRDGKVDEAEALQRESRVAGRPRAAARHRGRRRRRPAARPAPADPQPHQRRGSRRRDRGRQPGRAGGRLRRRRLRGAPARAALGDRHAARHPRQRARREDQRCHVQHATGPRRHPRPGAVPARPRPQRRRLRGDPPAVAGHDGDAHGDRPAAQVRRRRLRHRARRPVVHPDRRGAADLDRQRRDPRRGRPADADDGRHALLPARGGLGRARHPGPAARPRVRQGGGAGLRHRRAGPGPAGRAARAGRGHDRRARPGLPGARHLCRRPRPEPPPQPRHRGVRAGLRPVARGLLGVVVQRLPGPPGQRPLPARRGRRAPSSCTR